MNKTLLKITGVVALGLGTGFGATFYGMNRSTPRPTDTYYLNADKTNISGREYDDIVVGNRRNQTAELYLRNQKNELESVRSIREREEKQNDEWYKEQLREIEKTVQNLRETLDNLTE